MKHFGISGVLETDYAGGAERSHFMFFFKSPDLFGCLVECCNSDLPQSSGNDFSPPWGLVYNEKKEKFFPYYKYLKVITFLKKSNLTLRPW